MSGSGRTARFEQVAAVLDQTGLDAVVLRRPENFAWYSGGADNRVDHAAPAGVADVVVTRTGEHEWYAAPDDVISKLAGGAAIGADAPNAAEVDVAGLVAPLRYRLDDDAIDRYRMVGADTMAAVDAACAALTPAM